MKCSSSVSSNIAIQLPLNQQRYAFNISYKGTNHNGFSYQPTLEINQICTIEGRIRYALNQIPLTFKNISVSSRTDSGVHSTGNTFHVDIESDYPWTSQSLSDALNFHIQNSLNKNQERDIRISRVKNVSKLRVPNKFQLKCKAYKTIPWHARYAAISRTYIYSIINVPKDLAESHKPICSNVWMVPTNYALDISSMKQSCIYMQGYQDYSSFRNKKCQRSNPYVTVQEINIENQNWSILTGNIKGGFTPQLVTIVLKANSFLYHMVRNIVGCLIQVGKQKYTCKDVKNLVMAKNRALAPKIAPSEGLCLINVNYGDNWSWYQSEN